MGTTTTMKRTAAIRRHLATATAGLSLLALTETAQAQEIQVTGPLAGAPAVHNLRLHREGRIELAPAVTFTLLDEFQRTILVGARLNYNLFDWLALGVWGGATFGPLQYPTRLSERIQDVNEFRKRNDAGSLDDRLTRVNLGNDFTEQLGDIVWVASPQITAVPFRGKLSLFASIYVDTDLYFFAGPAFVGLKEREDCTRGQCETQFGMQSRTAIAPTFGLGLSFYVNQWSALGVEWRFLPFAWNTGGFDTAGTGQNDEFPDNEISSDDREFKFNQLVTVSYNFYYPFEHRISE